MQQMGKQLLQDQMEVQEQILQYQFVRLIFHLKLIQVQREN